MGWAAKEKGGIIDGKKRADAGTGEDSGHVQNESSTHCEEGTAMIDLRSDTKTRPTEKMRRAMAEAEVGDDVAGEDPTVNKLEAVAAELLGKEAGLLGTSGTQGNIVSLLALTEPGQKLIVEQDAHMFHYERGGVARLAGLLVHTLPGHYGAMDPEEVAAAIWPDEIHRAPTGAVALENTHNRVGGTCLSVEHTNDICEVAHRHGVPVHIDGARIFDAAVALEVEPRDLVAAADSVTFCLSKSLGAPVGSVICGEEDFIARAREYRKMLGGGMRQAGIIAGPGLVALEQELPRLHEDHQKARRIAEVLAELPGISLDLVRVQTNMVLFELKREDMTVLQLCEQLGEYDIKAKALSEMEIRFVLHRDISFRDTGRVCIALEKVLGTGNRRTEGVCMSRCFPKGERMCQYKIE